VKLKKFLALSQEQFESNRPKWFSGPRERRRFNEKGRGRGVLGKDRLKQVMSEWGFNSFELKSRGKIKRGEGSEKCGSPQPRLVKRRFACRGPKKTLFKATLCNGRKIAPMESGERRRKIRRGRRRKERVLKLGNRMLCSQWGGEVFWEG